MKCNYKGTHTNILIYNLLIKKYCASQEICFSFDMFKQILIVNFVQNLRFTINNQITINNTEKNYCLVNWIIILYYHWILGLLHNIILQNFKFCDAQDFSDNWWHEYIYKTVYGWSHYGTITHLLENQKHFKYN